jgi:hypothetical protein
MESQLLGDLADDGLPRALAWLDVPARDIPVLLVGRPYQHQPVVLVDEDDAGGDEWPGQGAGLGFGRGHDRDCRAVRR